MSVNTDWELDNYSTGEDIVTFDPVVVMLLPEHSLVRLYEALSFRKKCNRQMDKENKQTRLDGSIITTTQRGSFTTSFTTQEDPENMWLVLSQFAMCRTEFGEVRAFCVDELHSNLNRVMHLNTIRSMIARLKYKAWIKTHGTGWGKTRTAHRFIITTDGKIAWQRNYDR